MTHPPPGGMDQQMIFFDNRHFEITRDAIVFHTLYGNVGCEGLGFEEGLEDVVVPPVAYGIYLEWSML